jgi:hypothetical protein
VRVTFSVIFELDPRERTAVRPRIRLDEEAADNEDGEDSQQENNFRGK